MAPERVEPGSLEVADLTVTKYGRAMALVWSDHRRFSVIRPSHTRSLRLLPDA